ncbi:hypothetical protein SPFL3102_02841 [Sporomusaceae bacterium FL31]|nr:hypothetical protein SPFL3101_01171 [Sporomusaceae bacterium FL31]GCE35013.1 hypothetical protein SPFL3102_02841 [Sporomusaceae bacterium]
MVSIKNEIVSAIYPAYDEESYDLGNPFIEAIPKISNLHWSIITSYPNYLKKDNILPAEIKAHEVQNLHRLFVGLSFQKDLFAHLTLIIETAYFKRNPLFPEFREVLAKNNILDQTDLNGSLGRLIGVKGSGKSSTVLKILSYYPKVIKHICYREIQFYVHQVVWIKLDAPPDGNVQGLYFNLLKYIDNLLSTNYCAKLYRQSLSKEDLHHTVLRVLFFHGLGTLVIDNIQYFSLGRLDEKIQVANFINELCKLGMTVLLIGNETAHGLLFEHLLSSKIAFDLSWTKMQFDEEWEKFIRNLLKYQWTDQYTDYSIDLSLTFYEESGGILDTAKKLYQLCQYKAIELGEKVISPNLVIRVSHELIK